MDQIQASRRRSSICLGGTKPQPRFFKLASVCAHSPALGQEVARRGHTIGNHTDGHPRLTFLSPRRIVEELDRCAATLVSVTGRKTRWMRPPYGYRGPQLESSIRKQDANSRVVMWSVSGGDWRVQPPERVVNRLRRVRGGDIVLLHDGDHRTLKGDRAHTLAALEHWLPRWKDAGLRFAGLDDLERRDF